MELTEEHSKYRGQWGGRIVAGAGPEGPRLEEMWWSEPDRALARGGRLARARFALDVRHSFILRYFRAFLADWRPAGVSADPRLVDYGCGTGGTTLNFSAYLGLPITGYDVYETQLAIGRRFAAGTGCAFERLNEGGAIPGEPGSVDAIFSLDVLGHVPSIPVVLAHWRRALRPGTGTVLLFTEAHYSQGDRSIMARLARARGVDVCSAVPEHISLHPREALERMFAEAGFEVAERFSANVWHFLFFPKDYVLALRGKHAARGLYVVAWLWNRASRVLPFYPAPLNLVRLLVTRLRGREAYGTAYFYRLKAR